MRTSGKELGEGRKGQFSYTSFVSGARENQKKDPRKGEGKMAILDALDERCSRKVVGGEGDPRSGRALLRRRLERRGGATAGKVLELGTAPHPSSSTTSGHRERNPKALE